MQIADCGSLGSTFEIGVSDSARAAASTLIRNRLG